MLPLLTLSSINREESRKVLTNVRFQRIEGKNQFNQVKFRQPTTSFISRLLSDLNPYLSKSGTELDIPNLSTKQNMHSISFTKEPSLLLPLIHQHNLQNYFLHLTENCKRIIFVYKDNKEACIYYPISFSILELVHNLRLKDWWFIRRKPYGEFYQKPAVYKDCLNKKTSLLDNVGELQTANINNIVSVILMQEIKVEVPIVTEENVIELLTTELQYPKYKSLLKEVSYLSKQVNYNQRIELAMKFSCRRMTNDPFCSFRCDTKITQLSDSSHQIIQQVLCASEYLNYLDNNMDQLDILCEEQSGSRIDADNKHQEVFSYSTVNKFLHHTNREQSQTYHIIAIDRKYHFNLSSLAKVQQRFNRSKSLIPIDTFQSNKTTKPISIWKLVQNNLFESSKSVCYGSQNILCKIKILSILSKNLPQKEIIKPKSIICPKFNCDLNELWRLVCTAPIKVRVRNNSQEVTSHEKFTVREENKDTTDVPPMVDVTHESNDTHVVNSLKRKSSEAQNYCDESISSSTSTKHAKVNESKIIISEIFFERFPEVVCDLKNSFSVTSIDVPLQDEVDIIIDPYQGICIVDSDEFQSEEAFKDKMMKIINSSFKYAKLWMIIIAQDHTTANRNKIQISKTVARFPCTIILRDCVEGDVKQLSCLVAQIIATNEVKMRATNKTFLDLLTDSSFLAHAYFLQRFPSLNLYLASILLSIRKIHEIPLMDKNELIWLMDRLYPSGNNNIAANLLERAQNLMKKMK